MEVDEEMELLVKVRHGPRFCEALLKRTGLHRAHVRLREREKSLAPGQFAVFYIGDQCLGSAVICSKFAQPKYEMSVGSEAMKLGLVYKRTSTAMI